LLTAPLCFPSHFLYFPFRFLPVLPSCLLTHPFVLIVSPPLSFCFLLLHLLSPLSSSSPSPSSVSSVSLILFFPTSSVFFVHLMISGRSSVSYSVPSTGRIWALRVVRLCVPLLIFYVESHTGNLG
jgi:hypothetical protein